MAEVDDTNVNCKRVPSGSAVEQLLEEYGADHGNFITHLDTHPIRLKQIVFMPTFVMHALMALIMAWRIYSGTSRYSFISVYFGELIPTKAASRDPWYSLVFHAGIDYVVFNFFAGRVWWFLKGHFWLRLRYGFRETEVVFRKPTGWKRALHNGLPAELRTREWCNSIYRAINPRFLAENVGFNTRSDFWVMEYDAVCAAYAAANRGEIDIEEWKLKVWSKENGQWTVWEAWRNQDPQISGATYGIFKEKLQSMGRGDVLEKLTVFIQQQMTQPDGSVSITSVHQTDLMAQFFAREGIDMAAMLLEAGRELKAREAGVSQPTVPPPAQQVPPPQSQLPSAEQATAPPPPMPVQE